MTENKNQEVMWLEILREQERSGLSKINFCKEKGIGKGKFYYWWDRLGFKRASKNKRGMFSRVEVDNFAFNSEQESRTVIAIKYPNGAVIEIPFFKV